jgi:hypothetical protein
VCQLSAVTSLCFDTRVEALFIIEQNNPFVELYHASKKDLSFAVDSGKNQC